MLNQSSWRNFLYLLPAVLVYGLFLLLPLLASLGISFTEWDGTSRPVFAGISNYLRMFSDPVFWIALGNNAILMLFYTLLPIGVGLLLCSFLYETRNNTERSVLRILFFLPYIMPMAVLGVVWRWLYNPAFGPIDQVLRAIGLPQLAMSWLGDFTWALPAVGMVATWYFFGSVWCCLWRDCREWIRPCLKRRTWMAPRAARSLCALRCRDCVRSCASRCC